MQWQYIAENWVYLPPGPRGIIHGLGGTFIGATPHVTYRHLLEFLAHQGFAIISTPFLNTFDHQETADQVLRCFELALERLEQRRLLSPYLPIYSLGHSLGCKLHLLIGSLFDVERSGAILLAFNNYPARQSIPLWDQVVDRIAPRFALDLDVEFTPSPEETLQLVQRFYPTRRNLLVKFSQDNIDQTSRLYPVLADRFGSLTTELRLPGNHLTPIGQDLRWEVQQTFSPLDAMGQWVNQSLYRNLYRLEQEMKRWLLVT